MRIVINLLYTFMICYIVVKSSYDIRKHDVSIMIFDLICMLALLAYRFF